MPSLFDLAPGGVYHAGPVAGPAVRSYRTLSALPGTRKGPPGGLLSVALSLGSPPPGVTRHRHSLEPGLSSPHCCAAIARPSGAALLGWIVPRLKQPVALAVRKQAEQDATSLSIGDAVDRLRPEPALKCGDRCGPVADVITETFERE